ncbi:MAG TPA: HAD-IC family P-type ATPase, partial [Bacteroidales bacterium]|nr:HAD-IC family P-type ATPase [Bacteroidales bacterium]
MPIIRTLLRRDTGARGSEVILYSKRIADLEKEFATDIKKGLTRQEAEERIEEYGKNQIDRGRSVSPWEVLFRQFKNTITLLLFAASVVSFSIGEYIEGMAVIGVILLTAGFGFITEYSAEKSVEALRKMVVSTAKVLRNGDISQINAVDIVPGDIIVLEEGDRITADGRLFEADNLAADEAILTGESEPVSKHNRTINLGKTVAIADRKNMVFTGTAITRGNGKAIVTDTGNRTQMGSISTMLRETKDETTPLEKQLKKTGYFLIILTFAVTVIVAAAGLISGRPFVEVLNTSIALAVAAVPEGLPAVATITLAIGMRRMVRKNALIKNLPAVETLGSTTVICTDKTGTLTENQMTVQEIFIPGRDITVSGTGYAPEGVFRENTTEIYPQKDRQLSLLLMAGLLCSNAVLVHNEEKGWTIIGDPTEGALITVARKAGMDIKGLESDGYERLDELPFDSDEKFMAVLTLMPDSGAAIFLKGAPEVVLDKCDGILADGLEVGLSQREKNELLRKNKHLAQQGLRVLGIAYKEGLNKDVEIGSEAETGLMFLGFMGILDPPRPGIPSAIEEAQSAGIKIVMITGDHQDTALAIAQRIGMQGGNRVITGSEMDGLTVDELAESLRHNHIFARVSPKNKLDIVEALNKNGEIVAMIGDGVND